MKFGVIMFFTQCFMVGLLTANDASFSFNGLSGRAISPTSEQAAGITRWRTLFLSASEVGAGFIVPQIEGIHISASLSGSFAFTGALSEEIESEIERIAKATSKRVFAFYKFERRRLRQEAGDLYFTWFQAAAQFKFSNRSETENVLKTKAYKRFSSRSAKALGRLELSSFKSRFDARVDFFSTRLQYGAVRPLILVSEITLRSGKTFIVGYVTPSLVVAVQGRYIVDKVSNVIDFSKPQNTPESELGRYGEESTIVLLDDPSSLIVT